VRAARVALASVVAAAALVPCAPRVARAFASASTSTGSVTLDATGSIRLTGAWLHYADAPGLLPEDDDALAAATTRLIARGALGEEVVYEVNAFVELSRSPAASTTGAFATAGSFRSPYRAPALAGDFWSSGAVRGSAGLDRLRLTRQHGRAFLSVGRFPVNYGVMGLLSPNDFFAPFSATAINRVYKPGVDALSVGVNVGALSSLEVVGVMGYDALDGSPSWGRAATLLRGSVTAGGFEWAALGGKVAGRWIVGGSLQGELGPLGLRAEGHAGFPDADGDGVLERAPYGRIAAGVDTHFAWHDLALAAEYAFFSDGARGGGARYVERAMRLFPDDLGFLGQHYVVLSAGGTIVPILRAGAAVIVNAGDGSGLVTLSLGYDAADEATFSAGVLLPWGRRPESALELDRLTELGLAPVAVFVETQMYF